MQDNNLWLTTIPVLTTAHVSRETIGKLDNAKLCKQLGLTAAKYPEGYFLMVPYNDLRELPQDLQGLFQWANARGYTWVRLDCDGDTIEELTSYDW